jgi:hypothetical protein
MYTFQAYKNEVLLYYTEVTGFLHSSYSKQKTVFQNLHLFLHAVAVGGTYPIRPSENSQSQSLN